MAKVRISISLEAEQADQVKAHAEQAGMDVSSYLVSAAFRQIAETDAAEQQFAGIDALIAEAEQAADEGPDPAEAPGSLTEEDRRAVDEALRLLYGTGAEGRGEVA